MTQGWEETVRTAAQQALQEADIPDAVLLAADLHPWDGSLELSMCTQGEDADPEEQAAWTHFSFTEELEAWKPVHDLSRKMQQEYEASSDKQKTAREYFQATARALKTLNIKVSVQHPDDGEEFVT
jgi:hypothetical protein